MLSSAALSGLVGEADSPPMVILMCPSWLGIALVFLFLNCVYYNTLYIIYLCILSRIWYGQYIEVPAPLLRVPLARCFAQALLVVSRVSDAFKHIPIQHICRFLWVSYSDLESALLFLGGFTRS